MGNPGPVLQIREMEDVMIRECTKQDQEFLETYMDQDEGCRRYLNIFADAENKALVYADIENEVCKAIYFYLENSMTVYSRENVIDNDFLEQLFSHFIPESVTGLKENLKIVQWLLPDYVLEELEDTGEWGRLLHPGSKG